jgi:hypothetical protein
LIKHDLAFLEAENADLCRKNRRAGRAEKAVNRPPTLELAVADLSFFVMAAMRLQND